MRETLLFFALLLWTAPIMAKTAKFTPVENFSLDRYLGTWYEIARLPHSFEKDLDHVTATYSLRTDGKVKVVNQGFKNGKAKSALGKAKFASNPETGHLRVSFFWIFYGDYIIVELDPDYRYALVAGPSHDYLWILSRTPALAPESKERLLSKAVSLGFDTGKLIFPAQN